MEFRNFWNSDQFDNLRERIVTISGGIKSSKSLTLRIEANAILKKDTGSAEPFDGIVEYFWDNAASLMDIYATEEAKALMKEIVEYLGQFVDLGNSPGFFTEV